MKFRSLYFVLGAALLLIVAVACRQEAAPAEPTAAPQPPALDEYRPALLASFAPLPEVVEPENYELTDELIDLGRLLFYEERISISQEMSCNSCHFLDQYGVDGLQFSLGHDGQPVGRNSPTVYNAGLHIAQFWDGRAADLEAQALGPILDAGEMGMPDPEYVIAVLSSIPGYLPLFEAAFPGEDDPFTYDNVGQAIGAFERKLMTPDRFDDLLNGDEDALTEQEKRGLALFVNIGCASCHYGPALGGERYAVMGQVEPYPHLNDEGRYAITGEEADMFVFKVPGLRNVAMTAPYMHDGSINTLAEMVEIMATYQLGRELTGAQIADIVVFLEALTGELPMDYIEIPDFPPSGPDTPGPYEYPDS
jgi:cytochrome c peroxidase